MSDTHTIARLRSGIPNLDELLQGGIPRGSSVVVGGPPGSGKTILTQQICFHNASEDTRVLYFNTLSEPTAKTLQHSAQFDFFDQSRLERAISFVDLGGILRDQGLESASRQVMEQVRRFQPAIVVIDSFKVFNDLAESREELRKFVYELAVKLMAWETTIFLLGEFSEADVQNNPLFSIIDGMVLMSQREQWGEPQRLLQVVKMRGTDHSRAEHIFSIDRRGIELYAPRLTLRRQPAADVLPTQRIRTGISRLDELIGEGIPSGSSLLIAGAAGTGKTVLSLEFVYRGALAGERGILFSFEETPERLRAAAAGLGWDLDRQLELGMVEIVFIPQPEIQVERHLQLMKERIELRGARRVAIDSLSVFLHKVARPEIVREKVFQLASLVQNVRAVGFFATDIPYGSAQISRLGVEETVVDGVILLSSSEEGMERQRYLEIYKLRNTPHLKGRHSIVIGHGGVTVYPRYTEGLAVDQPPPPLEITSRLPSGVPGLDALLGGGLLERSVTLVTGSAGIGKSTLALQFLVGEPERREPALYVALEEGPSQLVKSADALGIPLRRAIDEGWAEIAYLSRDRVRPSQLFSLLSERIAAQKTRRFVLDSVNYLRSEGMSEDELRQLLYALVNQFKRLGTTTLLTLESREMYSTENLTDRQFSPVADNLIALRYTQTSEMIVPTLMVVKTRGSAHDFGSYAFRIGHGGGHVEKLSTGGWARRWTRRSRS